MKRLISFAIAAALALSMAACSGGKDKSGNDANTPSATPGANTEAVTPTEAATPTVVADTNPLTMLTQGRYVYSFYAEGHGNYTYFLHFYPEAPVLGAVFYAGYSNNGVKFAGTYTVEQKEKEYACFPDREAATVTDAVPPTGTAPYTITFYDFDGNEIESCGYDGEVLYNDLATIAASGSSPLKYFHDIKEDSEYAATYDGEVGVKYLEFVSPDDDTATVTLSHNQTYTDLIGMMIEGSWSMEPMADGGYTYTLKPNDSTDTGAKLSVSKDKQEAIYTPDGGDSVTLVTTAKTSAGSGEVTELFAFTGGFTTLSVLTDGTYKFAFESSNVEETGEWTFDKATFEFLMTQENGNVINGAIDGNTHAMTLHYTAVVNEQLQDDFTAEAAAWSVMTTFEPVSNELFAFTGGFTTLMLNKDNTYTFAFESSNVEETGKWAFDKAAYQLTLTQENGNVITASIDGTSHAMTLHYPAVVSEQLQDDFTAEASVWSVLTTFEPAVKELFSFEGGFTTLAIYTDNTYKFAFESSNVEETGKWAFDKAAYQFTLTQENGNVITASIDGDSHALKLHYTAVVSEQLQDDFTVGSDVWGPALTQ